MRIHRFQIVGLVLAWTLLNPGAAVAADRSCALAIPTNAETGWVFSIHPVQDSALVSASTGLFLYQDGTLIKFPEPLDFTSFHEAPDGVLVGSAQGLYRYHNGRLSEVPAHANPGVINDIHEIHGGLLIAAAHGVFHYRKGVLRKLPGQGEATRAYRINQLIDAVLVTVNGGNLVSYQNGTLQRVAFNSETGTVRGVYRIAEHGLVTAKEGLFRYRNGVLYKIRSVTEVGATYGAYSLPGGVFVPAEKGLFWYHDDTLTRVPSDDDTGGVYQVYQVKRDTFVSADEGLFSFRDGKLKQVPAHAKTGRVAQVHELRDVVLVRAKEGLFRYQDGELYRVPSDAATGGFFGVHQLSEKVFVRSDEGLFTYSEGALTKVPVDSEMGALYAFSEFGDAVLVGGVGGLFRYVDAPANTASTTLERYLLHAAAGEFRTIKTDVVYGCAKALELADFRLVDADDYKAVIEVSDARLSQIDSDRVTWSGRAQFTETGTYRARLALVEGNENVSISEPVEFRVAWGASEWLAHLGPWLLLIHAFIYTTLIFGSRWSRWCWALVNDPVWGKAGLWFGLAVRYVGPVQRWVMSYWFIAVRHSLKPVAYVPLPLTDEARATIRFNDLPRRLAYSRRLWIQGNAGMGKTAMVDALESVVFGDPKLPSLAAVYKHFGFVPIIIRLRRFSRVAPDLHHPEAFVPELARLAVAESGLEFRDRKLFRAILEYGGFGVVLDGANEIHGSDYLELSGCAIATRCVLITSQSLPVQRPDAFEVLRLPPAVGEALKPLLQEFLGCAEGERVFGEIYRTSLAAAMRSGYDVRLLADLVESTHDPAALPNDRLGLYEAIIRGVSVPDGRSFPEDELCQAAWEMWRDGERRLIPNRHLPRDLVMLLWREESKVLSSLDGEVFEFRHDQMRGYLAARWLANHVVAPLPHLESDASIWRLGRSDQEVVWGFFAAMVNRDRGPEIWQWATQSTERAVLQQALQQRADSDGWHLALPRTLSP